MEPVEKIVRRIMLYREIDIKLSFYGFLNRTRKVAGFSVSSRLLPIKTQLIDEIEKILLEKRR